jgi:hypothetical protein
MQSFLSTIDPKWINRDLISIISSGPLGSRPFGMGSADGPFDRLRIVRLVRHE